MSQANRSRLPTLELEKSSLVRRNITPLIHERFIFFPSLIVFAVKAIKRAARSVVKAQMERLRMIDDKLHSLHERVYQGRRLVKRVVRVLRVSSKPSSKVHCEEFASPVTKSGEAEAGDRPVETTTTTEDSVRTKSRAAEESAVPAPLSERTEGDGPEPATLLSARRIIDACLEGKAEFTALRKQADGDPSLEPEHKLELLDLIDFCASAVDPLEAELRQEIEYLEAFYSREGHIERAIEEKQIVSMSTQGCERKLT